MSNSQKHMITILKFQVFSPFIMITLLSTLRNSHLFSNHLHHLSSLSNQFESKHHTFTRLVPTQRSSTPPTIQRLKRCHSNTSMKTVVISKLNQRKICIL